MGICESSLDRDQLLEEYGIDLTVSLGEHDIACRVLPEDDALAQILEQAGAFPYDRVTATFEDKDICSGTTFEYNGITGIGQPASLKAKIQLLRWKSIRPMLSRRANAGAAAFCSDSQTLCVVGGLGRPTRESSLVNLSSVERFTLAATKWSYLDAMEDNSIDDGYNSMIGAVPHMCREAAVAESAGVLYVVGGGYPANGVVLTYTVAPNSGESGFFEGKGWKTLPHLHTHRAGCAAAISGDKLVVVGGANEKDGLLATVEILDLKAASSNDSDSDSVSWTEAPPMPAATQFAAVAVLNRGGDGERVFLIGGDVANPADVSSTVPTAAVFCFDMAGQSWSRSADMLCARSGAVCGIFEGQLVVAGGAACLNGETDFAERYIEASNTWEKITPMSEPRLGSCGGVLADGLYICGGSDPDGNPLNSVVRLGWQDYQPARASLVTKQP